MSIEESLNPRYKVIAPYPNSKYRMGEIINYTDQSGSVTSDTFCQFYDKYPHLFKRLEWWEEMDEKDMPEYVKHKIDAEVYKLKKQAETTPSDAYCVKRASIGSDSYYQWLSLYDLLPATYEEYEQYLQSKK